MENTNNGGRAAAIEAVGAAGIWIPVIEVGFGREMSLARFLWRQLEDKTFRRQEWNDKTGRIIELSGVFKSPAAADAARFLLDRWRPAFRRSSGSAFTIIYDEKIWQMLFDYKLEEETQPPRKIFFINADTHCIETAEFISTAM